MQRGTALDASPKDTLPRTRCTSSARPPGAAGGRHHPCGHVPQQWVSEREISARKDCGMRDFNNVWACFRLQYSFGGAE